MVLQKYVNLRHLNTKQSNINDKLLLMNIIVRRTLLSASILSLMPIMANAQTDKDSVNYDLKLDTVHVTARRPIIKTEGSKDIVHVKGSYLGKLGNLGNMLVATPGISTVGQNMYEVVGKGAPKYYVDGREVTSQDIFKTIKSSNIDRIEIEREPGENILPARMPSSTSSPSVLLQTAFRSTYTIRQPSSARCRTIPRSNSRPTKEYGHPA